MSHRIFASDSKNGLCHVVIGFDVQTHRYLLSVSDLSNPTNLYFTTSDSLRPLTPQAIIAVLKDMEVNYPERLERDLESDIDHNMIHQDYGFTLFKNVKLYNEDPHTRVVVFINQKPDAELLSDIREVSHPWIRNNALSWYWCQTQGDTSRYFAFENSFDLEKEWKSIDRSQLMCVVHDSTLPL
jgi:hypothetical protein